MTSASVLAEKGFRRILLLDEYDGLGGNHISLDIGPYSFDIGSFIFHDKSPFLARFPAVLDRYLPFDGTTGRLDMQGGLATYPFDFGIDIASQSPAEWGRIFLSLVWGRLTRTPDRNAHEFVSYWLGDRLARRTGLIAYLSRFYGTEPTMIEGDFARKRMRWVSTNASIKGQMRRLTQRGQAGCRSFVRPRNGFSDLYGPAGTALSRLGVEIALSQDVESISRMPDGSFVVRTAAFTTSSPAVFSTVPLDVCARWCGLSTMPSVRYATLTSLFYSFEGQRSFPYHVLYNFSKSGFWKRLTMHSDCYGLANGRQYFSVEVIGDHHADRGQVFDQDFRAHARSNGIFEGDLVLEGSRVTASAYPVYLEGAGAGATAMIEALRRFGIRSFGRQGGFDYQPTAHVSAATAEKFLHGVA